MGFSNRRCWFDVTRRIPPRRASRWSYTDTSSQGGESSWRHARRAGRRSQIRRIELQDDAGRVMSLSFVSWPQAAQLGILRVMKSKKRALTDYINRFETFPCGDVVQADGSNAYITPAKGRDGRPYWRVRCLPCWRSSAADAMARLRASRLKAAKKKKSAAAPAKKRAAAPAKKRAAAPAKKRAASPAKKRRTR